VRTSLYTQLCIFSCGVSSVFANNSTMMLGFAMSVTRHMHILQSAVLIGLQIIS